MSPSVAARFWLRYEELVMNEHRPSREAYLTALADAFDATDDVEPASAAPEGVDIAGDRPLAATVVTQIGEDRGRREVVASAVGVYIYIYITHIDTCIYSYIYIYMFFILNV